MHDPRDQPQLDAAFTDFFRCTPEPSTWTFEVAFVTWPGPHTPALCWHPFRRWKTPPTLSPVPRRSITPRSPNDAPAHPAMLHRRLRRRLPVNAQRPRSTDALYPPFTPRASRRFPTPPRVATPSSRLFSLFALPAPPPHQGTVKVTREPVPYVRVRSPQQRHTVPRHQRIARHER